MNSTYGIYRRGVKRFLDVALGTLALLVLLPILALIALTIRIHLGSPVLFTQKRLGLRGRPFVIRKFRTMTDMRGDDGELLPDAERLTPFGRFLRATSLDELPELLNVLRGEMSLVGPRPLYSQYRDLYSPVQFRRHEVLPGITGWAQVNGRNAVTWEQKFEMDVWYVDNQSLQLDLKIILLTLLRTVLREDVSQPGHATAQEFKGSLRKGA
jgi:lipopolysaccharide/colanic/teichoic acid biosynthesis glycosyltransferase